MTTIRRVRPDEWREVRELRLEAVRDPVANIAFLSTEEQTLAEPDAFWIGRAAEAAEGGPNAQFVALDDAGTWVGTATVVGERIGPQTVEGSRLVPRDHLVVGVYVTPAQRGTGTIDALMDACATYARAAGARQLGLDVHIDNHRAQRAYERFGFRATGAHYTSVAGTESVMVLPLV